MSGSLQSKLNNWNEGSSSSVSAFSMGSSSWGWFSCGDFQLQALWLILTRAHWGPSVALAPQGGLHALCQVLRRTANREAFQLPRASFQWKGRINSNWCSVGQACGYRFLGKTSLLCTPVGAEIRLSEDFFSSICQQIKFSLVYTSSVGQVFWVLVFAEDVGFSSPPLLAWSLVLISPSLLGPLRLPSC